MNKKSELQSCKCWRAFLLQKCMWDNTTYESDFVCCCNICWFLCMKLRRPIFFLKFFLCKETWQKSMKTFWNNIWPINFLSQLYVSLDTASVTSSSSSWYVKHLRMFEFLHAFATNGRSKHQIRIKVTFIHF